MSREHAQSVSVAIPAFNEREFICEAIQSVADQAPVLAVFDNASTDGTNEICSHLASRFPWLRLVRHDTNIGAINNFKISLDQASTPFFMWLGAHDVVSDGYVSGLAEALHSVPAAVLAFAPVRHLDRFGNRRSSYDYSFAHDLADPDPFNRVCGLIRGLQDCSLLHGVFRTNELRKAWFHQPCIGLDNVMLCRAAELGPFLYVTDHWYGRREVREKDSLDAQIVRVHPESRLDRDRAYHEMLKAQWEIVVRLARGRPLENAMQKERIRWLLIRRFGYFPGNGLVDDLMNRVVSITFRSARRIVPLFTHGYRDFG